MINRLKVRLKTKEGKNRILELIRFGINGGISFFVDYVILYILTKYAGIYYLVSSCISFSISMVVNYVICFVWVFRGEKNKGARTTTIFVATSAMGLGMNQVLMWSMVRLIGFHFMLAKLFSANIIWFWNYFTKRRAVYSLPPGADPPAEKH
ncbi:GtrA family protein [Papillibacter cinnamivorans]|uniref:Putative flippase GtrA (Transmembrane translocase of bactoprenol-linked glucose) n=1 Tax=Papillibacter cinnamivorans DSM 12816 TaxID=1122930 RepID=A0A1W2BKZ3_9FIRM|nr:GtrA family protein [Papillibacter cinnamivorans]SMC73490.1 Putative flippase GtrA (transmembrane translocase of bactoprenol-linked glucose) [Papillibacter cinnamivorans DSM 12816]